VFSSAWIFFCGSSIIGASVQSDYQVCEPTEIHLERQSKLVAILQVNLHTLIQTRNVSIDLEEITAQQLCQNSSTSTAVLTVDIVQKCLKIGKDATVA
jgi:hypothetical protein